MNEDTPRSLPLPVFAMRGLLLATASGVAATVALAASPYGRQIPPIIIPHTFIDLRFVGLPLLFLATHIAVSRTGWPMPAIALPGLALSVAASAHFQGSSLLDFIVQGLEGSEEGTRVGMLRTFASGASLLLALAAALERGRDRMAALATAAGVGDDRVRALKTVADAQASRTLAFTAAAFTAFALVARLGDVWLGRAQAPVPELIGVVLAVGVALLLFPGVGEGVWRWVRRVEAEEAELLRAE